MAVYSIAKYERVYWNVFCCKQYGQTDTMQCKFEYLNKTQLVDGTATSTRLDCDPVTVSMGKMWKLVMKALLFKNVTTLIADNYKIVLKVKVKIYCTCTYFSATNFLRKQEKIEDKH